MATTRNKNHNDDDASSGKRVKTCNNGGVGPWSDLNHHVLYLVIMKLRIVDYLSFGRVCKSWRSLAISERNIFLASKLPMTIFIRWDTKAKHCYLEDFEGREHQTTTVGTFAGGTCVGLTSGYLIFFMRKTCDFWLVNPITRHQHDFKKFPIKLINHTDHVSAILVYSHSINGWVFVVTHYFSSKIWFSKAGTGIWNIVHCRHHEFRNLRAFKGIIYALNSLCKLYELRLDREPKLTLVETKNSIKPFRHPKLLCSGKSIYMMDHTPEDQYRFHELDFCEMKWVLRKSTVGERASFLSNLKHGVADNNSVFGESDGKALLLGHHTGDMLKLIEVEKTISVRTAKMWYFPCECLNVDVVN